MRIPDLEKLIEEEKDHLMNTCSMCGRHRLDHTSEVYESTMYCRPTPGGPRRYFVSLLG